MKNAFRNIYYLIALVTLVSACSTAKNTWGSRNIHALSTHYNVYFNANESYKEGLSNINKQHVDDYSVILPLYTISLHSNASAATSQMDRTIEKTQKAIKLHSIKKKPNKDQERMKDPKYQAFLKQEEYNSEIDEAWILLGKAQFHKAEFLAAVGTFTYTINHFFWNKECVSEARIWLARSYLEMGWVYEAEDILNKANKDQVPAKYSGIYSATSSDLLIKNKKYKEAIPLLTIAAREEKDKTQRTRFYYVLGQLYRLEKNDAQAKYYFSKVIKASPPTDMEFNARISRAEADTENPDDAIKFLQKMLKNTKFTDYKDKIYYTIGNIYQKQNKQTEAVKNYHLAIDNSGNNIINKVQILISLADLYYKQGKYIEAQPYYSEAASIMPIENPEFERINTRSQMLDELNKQYESINLQDSLQRLSKLSEVDKKSTIEGLITKLQAEEVALKQKLLDNANAQSLDPDADDTQSKTPSFGIKTGDWYFYNNLLISSGRADFKRRWGTRKLEDNWRRLNKAVLNGDDFSNQTATSNIPDDNTNQVTDDFVDKSTVNTDINVYLKQIPTSDEDITKSNEQIADALYNIGMMYKEKIEDKPKAIETFDELERRFPKEKRLPDIYYNLYQMSMKANDTISANAYRTQLIEKFPESFYAKMFSMPDYITKMAKLKHNEDSIYQATYVAFLKDDFTGVSDNFDMVKKDYPLTDLMPKFMFLNALSKGKSSEIEPFIKGLEDLVTEYPQSDVSMMAREILALASEGQQPQAGGSHGSIINRRDSLCLCQNQVTDTLSFEKNYKDKHLIIVVTPKNSAINKLQYDVAIYNFTGFMIKDFDLDIRKYSTSELLIISMLDGYEEALWYLDGLNKNTQIKSFVKVNNCYSFVISDSNYQLLKKGHAIEDYITFLNDSIALNESQKVLISQVDVQVPKAQIQVNNKPTSNNPANITVAQSASSTPKQEQAVVNPIESKRVVPTNAKPDTLLAKSTIQKTNTNQPVTKTDTLPTSKVTAPKPKAEPTPEKIIAKPPVTQVIDKTPVSYTFNPQEMQAYGILVQKGSFNAEEIKNTLDKYNASNYPVSNYTSTIQEFGTNKIIIIGWLPNVNAAKTYLFGIIRRSEIFESLKNTEYRNIIISKSNLEKLISSQQVTNYLEFNRQNNMR